MAFDIHLALKLSQCQTRFFYPSCFSLTISSFLGQIPVLCTAQMNKNSQNPQRSAFNFSKTSLILTASNKMAACLTPGRKETGAEVASFPPFSPLAGHASLWPITTKIDLTRTKWVGREKIPLRLEDLSENIFLLFDLTKAYMDITKVSLFDIYHWKRHKQGY